MVAVGYVNPHSLCSDGAHRIEDGRAGFGRQWNIGNVDIGKQARTVGPCSKLLRKRGVVGDVDAGIW